MEKKIKEIKSTHFGAAMALYYNAHVNNLFSHSLSEFFSSKFNENNENERV